MCKLNPHLKSAPLQFKQYYGSTDRVEKREIVKQERKAKGKRKFGYK